MLYQPYYNPIGYLAANEPKLSYIRVLHASPNAPGVDVYLNNRLIVRNLKYKMFTSYMRVLPGNYSVKVYPSGQTNNPVIDTNVEILPQSIYTTAAIGKLEDIELYVIPDPAISPLMNMTSIRFIHLSPNAPSVDITLPNGTILFSDVSYKEITDYIPVPPGRYTLQARLAGTDKVVLTVPNIVLMPDKNLSAYAVGLVGEQPPLQLLIPLDGSSYLPV